MPTWLNWELGLVAGGFGLILLVIGYFIHRILKNRDEGTEAKVINQINRVTDEKQKKVLGNRNDIRAKYDRLRESLRRVP